MKPDETILIIDDDRALQQSCRQVFATNSYIIESSFDGASGIAKYDTIEPDLVLVDLCMPGLGGIEVLEKLKSKDPDCVAVVITAYGTISTAVEAMKRGAYDFIPKPFTPDQLRFIVRRGLERRRFIKETARLRREKRMMRDNFVSMVSHELRSPLAAVQQKLMLVTGGYSGEVSAEARMAILAMQDRIDGLISLIGDWLDLSRIEAGGIVGEKDLVDLRSVVTGVIDTLGPLAEKAGVTLRIGAGDPIPQIAGNLETLRMLFSNLIDNAIKYNHEGGSVTASFLNIGKDVKVVIRDTGIGIPRDSLPLVFEQFYRVKGRGTANGSGLGLSMCRRIVELHGGTLEVESEVGKGSVFTVCLPNCEDQ